MKTRPTATLCRWELQATRSFRAARILAEEGWELVTVTISPDGSQEFFLKRPCDAGPRNMSLEQTVVYCVMHQMDYEGCSLEAIFATEEEADAVAAKAISKQSDLEKESETWNVEPRVIGDVTKSILLSENES